MSKLSVHRSPTTQVLEVLFPNGTWRDLLRVVAWELYDQLTADDVYRWRKWGIYIVIPRFLLEAFLTALFGARP